MSRARIEIRQERIAEFCWQRHIRWLALFGSVLREDFRPESDVDVLVEFEPEQKYTYSTLARIENDLSSLLLGRKVDRHVSKSLHPFIRDKVLGQAEALYDGA